MEDDERTLKTLKRIAEGWNPDIKVFGATNSRTAGMVFRQWGPFDAMVTDIGLTGGDNGLALVSERGESIPVGVFSTGVDAQTGQLEELKDGGLLVAYERKPVALEALKTPFEKLLNALNQKITLHQQTGLEEVEARLFAYHHPLADRINRDRTFRVELDGNGLIRKLTIPLRASLGEDKPHSIRLLYYVPKTSIVFLRMAPAEIWQFDVKGNIVHRFSAGEGFWLPKEEWIQLRETITQAGGVVGADFQKAIPPQRSFERLVRDLSQMGGPFSQAPLPGTAILHLKNGEELHLHFMPGNWMWDRVTSTAGLEEIPKVGEVFRRLMKEFPTDHPIQEDLAKADETFRRLPQEERNFVQAWLWSDEEHYEQYEQKSLLISGGDSNWYVNRVIGPAGLIPKMEEAVRVYSKVEKIPGTDVRLVVGENYGDSLLSNRDAPDKSNRELDKMRSYLRRAFEDYRSFYPEEYPQIQAAVRILRLQRSPSGPEGAMGWVDIPTIPGWLNISFPYRRGEALEGIAEQGDVASTLIQEIDHLRWHEEFTPTDLAQGAGLKKGFTFSRDPLYLGKGQINPYSYLMEIRGYALTADYLIRRAQRILQTPPLSLDPDDIRQILEDYRDYISTLLERIGESIKMLQSEEGQAVLTPLGRERLQEFAQRHQDHLNRLKDLRPAAGLEERVMPIEEAPLRVIVADKMDETKLGVPGAVNVSSLSGAEKIDQIVSTNPEVLIVRSATKVDRSLIDRLPHLRAIIRGGHGLDNVDTDYAQSKGIKVFRTLGSDPSVAALAMRMIARARAIQAGLTAQSDQVPASLFTIPDWTQAVESKLKKMPAEERPLLRQKADELFQPIDQVVMDSLKGQRLGLIGFGPVGQRIAAVAKEQGMEVLVYAPSLEANPTSAQSLGYRFATKEEIYRSAHYVALATGLSKTGPKKNVGMIDEAAVDEMLKNEDLIALIDPDRLDLLKEGALARLIERKKVQIMIDEIPKTEFLRQQALFTDHLGASTTQAEDSVVANTAALLKQISAEIRSTPNAGLEEEPALMSKRMAPEGPSFYVGDGRWVRSILPGGGGQFTKTLLQGLRLPGVLRPNLEVLELGTGEGSVAVGIAGRVAHVDAVELDAEAAQRARQNVERNGLSNVRIYTGDLTAPVSGKKYDLIITDPPAVPFSHRMREEFRGSEWVRLANDGGTDGRMLLDRILREATPLLKEGGSLILNHPGFIALRKTERLVHQMKWPMEILFKQDVRVGTPSPGNVNIFQEFRSQIENAHSIPYHRSKGRLAFRLFVLRLTRPAGSSSTSAGLEELGVRIVNESRGTSLFIPQRGLQAHWYTISDGEEIPSRLLDILDPDKDRIVVPLADVRVDSLLSVQEGALPDDVMAGLEEAGVEVRRFRLGEVPPPRQGRENVYVMMVTAGSERRVVRDPSVIIINLSSHPSDSRPRSLKELGALINIARGTDRRVLWVGVIYRSDLQNAIIAVDTQL